MGTMSSIAIDLEGIGRILLNCNLAVPINQRSYAWEEEHVRDLLSDVETAMSEGAQEYFIGSIVTTKNQTARAEVADGQQRLATITIILAAIRDFFYESGDKERANAITGELLHKKDLRTLDLIPKLQLNNADNEYFVNRILLLPDDPKRATPKTKPSHLRIDVAATIARDHIRSLGKARDATDRLTEIVTYLTDNVKVIWVRVPDDTNAFRVFETLNDRGLKLAITDLLKNLLFGLAGGRLNEVQASWTAMLSALEAIEEENAVLTYLRHYWSSRQGLVREKELYIDIKKKINNASKAVSFTADLERNAHIYVAIVNTADTLWAKYGDTCKKHMDTINTLRMIQVRPLILSVLDSFGDAEVKATVRNIVSWSVRFLIHGGLGSGAIEEHNCAAAKDVREKKISTATQLFTRLKSVLPNDAQFRASFAAATVSKGYLARYYLRALEQQKKADPEPELVPNPNTEIVNLEHVLPQNASSSWSYIPSDEQVFLLKRIGNMALMKTKINTEAGNDSFAFKKKFYSKSDFKLTSELSAESVWNRAKIDKRQSHLADLAVKTWPLK